MGTVIGYKGNCLDRELDWRMMRSYREAAKVFAAPIDGVPEDWRKKVQETNGIDYKSSLKLYVA